MLSKSVLTSLLAAAPGIASVASCSSHTVPVKANANNGVIFAPSLDLTSVSGVESFLSSGAGFLGQLAGFLPVSGTYQIAMKYCKPEINPTAPPGRSKEVQVLLHGVPYNSVSWREQKKVVTD